MYHWAKTTFLGLFITFCDELVSQCRDLSHFIILEIDNENDKETIDADIRLIDKTIEIDFDKAHPFHEDDNGSEDDNETLNRSDIGE